MPRRRLTTMIALGTLAATLLLLTQCGGEPKAGHVVVDPPSLTFGQIVYRDVVKQTFVLRNEGPRPVYVARVGSNCACASTSRFERTLEPGDEREIVLTIESARLSPMVLKGKKVEIFTNDPKAKRLTLPFEAEIVGTHDMNPLFLEPGLLDEGGRAKRHTIRLRERPGVTLEVAAVRPSPANILDAEVREVPGGADVEVFIREDAEAGTGRFKGKVEIDVRLTLPSGDQRTRTEVVPMEGTWP